MLQRLPAALLLLAAAGCEPAPPDRARMEAIAGARLGSQTHSPRSAVATAWDAYSKPIPNQMGPAVEDGTHLWWYPFTADSTFRPPPSSPLRCEAVTTYGTPRLTCGAEAADERGAWTYRLHFSPSHGEGEFSASLRPPP